jgi:hypothetical protein
VKLTPYSVYNGVNVPSEFIQRLNLNRIMNNLWTERWIAELLIGESFADMVSSLSNPFSVIKSKGKKKGKGK